MVIFNDIHIHSGDLSGAHGQTVEGFRGTVETAANFVRAPSGKEWVAGSTHIHCDDEPSLRALAAALTRAADAIKADRIADALADEAA